MLYEMIKDVDFDKLFTGEFNYHPFPVYREREAWDGIEDSIKLEWITKAENFLGYNWPAMRMDFYLNVRRTGEIFKQWQFFCERRSILGIFTIAECMEGKDRFLDQIINGAIAICEETCWIQGLSMRDKGWELLNENDDTVDLASTETAQLFAWITYLLGDVLDSESKEICGRMKREVYRRVLRKYLERDDFWWMGFVPTRINNWNPWCNVNMLFSCAFMDFEPKDKADALVKIARSLDKYIEQYPDDGACDEGPMYWGAAGAGLGNCVEILKGITNGAVDGTGIEKLKNIGTYFAKVHIHDDWFVDYADGDARFNVGASVFRFGRMIGDESLMRLGATADVTKPSTDSWFQINGHLTSIFDKPLREKARPGAPYIKQSFFNNCEILCAREKEGSPEGFFLSAKGGNNVESHNHNDVGNFIVYLDGSPLFIDLGTEEYSSKTFSKDRFDLWYLQSQYHNCPTIAGVMQHDGKEYYAGDTKSEITENSASITMDIAPAYPGEAGIMYWQRLIALDRLKEHITITDDFELTDKLSNAETTYNFMSLNKPVVNGNVILIESDKFKNTAVLEFDADALTASVEYIAINESRLNRNWGGDMYRIVFKEKLCVNKGRRVFTVGKGKII